MVIEFATLLFHCADILTTHFKNSSVHEVLLSQLEPLLTLSRLYGGGKVPWDLFSANSHAYSKYCKTFRGRANIILFRNTFWKSLPQLWYIKYKIYHSQTIIFCAKFFSVYKPFT